MSARAAVRLEALGFENVYDYAAGKKDWLAAGLPDEGTKADAIRAGDLARSNPPTCSPNEPAETLREREDVRIWRLCVVTDADDVVHGLISAEDLGGVGPRTTAEDFMRLGPTTIRPNSSAERALKIMGAANVDSVLITTGFGELLGLLMRDDVGEESSPS